MGHRVLLPLTSSVAIVGPRTPSVGSFPVGLAFRLAQCWRAGRTSLADAERLSTGRLLSLSARACAFPSGPRCPLPGTVFHIAAGLAGSWAYHAQELCLSVGAVMPHMCGVVPGCLPSLARRWFDSQVRPSLDSAFRHRVVGSASVSPWFTSLCQHWLLVLVWILVSTGVLHPQPMLDCGALPGGAMTPFQVDVQRGTTIFHLVAHFVLIQLETSFTACVFALRSTTSEPSGVRGPVFLGSQLLNGAVTRGSSIPVRT